MDSNKRVVVLYHGKCNQIENSRDRREQVMELEYVPKVITGYTEKIILVSYVGEHNDINSWLLPWPTFSI